MMRVFVPCVAGLAVGVGCGEPRGGRELDLTFGVPDPVTSTSSDTTGGDDTDGADGADATGTTGGGGDGEPEPPPATVCYPGPLGDWTACVPLHAPAMLPEGYEYPAPYRGDPNYRPPVAFLDLGEIDPQLLLAPNFELREVASFSRGRWAIVQPHAIVALQQLRDLLGPLRVSSGYRSPTHNAEIGGAAHSRHMYGDAFDLDPESSSLAVVEAACLDHGGFLARYPTHVHCDWRRDPVDVRFFGSIDDG